MISDTYSHIHDYLQQLPVISTHEHHLKDEDQARLTLDGIINHSYVSWQNIPLGSTKEERTQFINQARHNSYFVWLEKSLGRLYKFGGRITADVWEDLSDQISKKHENPEAHIQILRKNCRYHAALSDIYWSPGSDLGHPDLFKPVVRTDMFVKCFHPSQRDHDDRSPWEFMPLEGLSFGEYMEYLENFHREKVRQGAVAFKLATAYERPISFEPVSYDTAARLYMMDPEEASYSDAIAYGNYIVNRTCELAAELGVPYQIHTGLGQLAGSNPMLLEPLIERHPETNFVLFHGGYPWYHETGALAHNHSNVMLDMVWLPLICTSAAIQALHEYIEVVPSSDRISWGSDCWTSEEALGALLAFEHVIAKVLSDKVDDGYFSMDDAKELSEKLLFRNASGIYGMDPNITYISR